MNAVRFHAAMSATVATAWPLLVGDDRRTGWVFITLFWLVAWSAVGPRSAVVAKGAS